MGKKDPAWKYGTPIEGPSKNVIYCRCSFCEQIISNGISRLKAHLAGNHNQVKLCPKVPREVKEEIQNMLTKGNLQKEESQNREAERVDIGSYFSSKGSVSDRGTRGPMDRFLTEVDSQRLEVGNDSPNPHTPKELRNVVCFDIGRFFIENGIAFHAASSPSFVGMCRSIGNYGRGLKPPTSYELGSWILDEEKKTTQTFVDDVKKTWTQTGVSIVSDGWKDIRGRQLINFLVNNPYGTMFLKTVDASDSIKTGEMLFHLLDDVVEEVGEDLVVQVVTDNASNYVAAGKLLMAKRQRLWWTPCAAHCIDLMLEKIGELPQHRHALRKAKKASNFIYNHGWVLSLMRKHTERELVRPAATRFATAYLTLQSILDLKQPLQSMFTSREWSHCTWSKKSEGKDVKKIILMDKDLWPSVVYAIKTTKPLFSVLRMADSEKVPGMGFLYGSMEKAKKEIQDSLGNSQAAYSEIIKIIDAKWENQMHRPLHAAACFLNPQFQYDDNWKPDVHVKIGLYQAMDKLIPDDDEKEKANLQLDSFLLKMGLFGCRMALATASKRSPADWWTNFGDECPELRSFAVKVLSLTCSSSACERNWSTFNQIHTKRRNRLTVDKLNSLAYCMYNKKLKERHLKKIALKEDEDPLLLDRCPSDDEWVAEVDDEELPISDDETQDYTQGDTQGDTSSARASKKRNTSSRGPSTKDKGKRMRIIDEEPDWEDDENEEEEDDDRNVAYADSSMSGDSLGGDGGGDDASFDPNFRPLDTNDSLLFVP